MRRSKSCRKREALTLPQVTQCWKQEKEAQLPPPSPAPQPWLTRLQASKAIEVNLKTRFFLTHVDQYLKMKLLSVPARSSLSISDRNAYFLRRNPHSLSSVARSWRYGRLFRLFGSSANSTSAGRICRNSPRYSCVHRRTSGKPSHGSFTTKSASPCQPSSWKRKVPNARITRPRLVNIYHQNTCREDHKSGSRPCTSTSAVNAGRSWVWRRP